MLRRIDRAHRQEEATMAKTYYSAIVERPVGDVWPLVRDFNNYPRYIDGVDASVIEDDKSGDSVGAIRRFRYGGHWIRQRLVALSDDERQLTYVGLDPFPFPSASDGQPAPIDYQGTIRLTPILDGDRTFVEWWLDYDGAGHERERWNAFLACAIAEWVASLARHLPASDGASVQRSYFSKSF